MATRFLGMQIKTISAVVDLRRPHANEIEKALLKTDFIDRLFE